MELATCKGRNSRAYVTERDALHGYEVLPKELRGFRCIGDVPSYDNRTKEFGLQEFTLQDTLVVRALIRRTQPNQDYFGPFGNFNAGSSTKFIASTCKISTPLINSNHMYVLRTECTIVLYEQQRKFCQLIKARPI